MRIEEWWPQVDEPTRQWLINNNGEAIPKDILATITALAGPPSAADSWVGEDGPDGFMLSDEAVDWIEAAANGEDAGQ